MSTEMSRRFAADKDFLMSLGVDAGDAMEAAAVWDSESRQSPYSTVADPEEEFCMDCEAVGGTCAECFAYGGEKKLS